MPSKFVVKLYKKVLIKRYNPDPFMKYFSAEDFPGLKSEPFEFTLGTGVLIRGHFYHYGIADAKNLVIFCHGLGPGHCAYMREIETIAKKGYRVLAWDYTGCNESEGADPRGLIEPVHILDEILDWMKDQEAYKNLKIHLVGHSWGGFTSAAILKYQKGIESVSAISGFRNMSSLMEGYLGRRFVWLEKQVCAFEAEANPDYADADTYDALKDTKTRVLVVHSEDDPIVKFGTSTGYLKEHIQNAHVRFFVVSGKKHNPHYTQKAVEILNTQVYTKKKFKTDEEKRAYFSAIDFWAATEQDEAVWKEIFKNIENQ